MTPNTSGIQPEVCEYILWELKNSIETQVNEIKSQIEKTSVLGLQPASSPITTPLMEVYPHLRGGRVKTHLVKATLSKTNQDSNLDLPVIKSLVYRECSTLDRTATEAALLRCIRICVEQRVKNYFGKHTLITPDQDSNLDFLVIDSLVYCESSALDHEATEVVKSYKITMSRTCGAKGRIWNRVQSTDWQTYWEETIGNNYLNIGTRCNEVDWIELAQGSAPGHLRTDITVRSLRRAEDIIYNCLHFLNGLELKDNVLHVVNMDLHTFSNASFYPSRIFALTYTTRLEMFKAEIKEVYPYLRGRRFENYLIKATLSTANRDSNPNLPVIGRVVYWESDALDYSTTETVGRVAQNSEGNHGAVRWGAAVRPTDNHLQPRPHRLDVEAVVQDQVQMCQEGCVKKDVSYTFIPDVSSRVCFDYLAQMFQALDVTGSIITDDSRICIYLYNISDPGPLLPGRIRSRGIMGTRLKDHYGVLRGLTKVLQQPCYVQGLGDITPILIVEHSCEARHSEHAYQLGGGLTELVQSQEPEVLVVESDVICHLLLHPPDDGQHPRLILFRPVYCKTGSNVPTDEEFEKTTPSSPERDLNLDFPVLGSRAQQETSALANYATETDLVEEIHTPFLMHPSSVWTERKASLTAEAT
uniref:Uncharacterized protein n=1 Tax=Timema tahoe TaxID=61484 RepID=A0A7R9NZ48_9NEOP|nr:unnamed protein product [Timema tahoe]